jgi:hypothetical protein
MSAGTCGSSPVRFRAFFPCKAGHPSTADSLRSRIVLLLLVLLSTSAHAAVPDALERQKIDYLIASVETLQGAEFIRNGKSYDARAAADHLRLKLRTAGARVATADDFIRYCASVSSVSGTPYQIRFADGSVVSSEAFLRQRLAEFEREHRESP